MASDNRSNKLPKKKVVKKKAVKSGYPKIYRDKENNFLSFINSF